MLTLRSANGRPWRPGSVRAWRQASRSTHWPSGMIRPVSSATGMNVRRIRPRWGWRQRTSASTPRCGRVRSARPAGSAARAARGDRALEVGAELVTREHHRVHLGLEHAVGALAVGLGAVHRGVGVADQLLGVAVRLGTTAMPTLPRSEIALCSAQRGRERLEHPLGRFGRLLSSSRSRQHGELVTAEASGRVARADARASRCATSTSTWSPAAWPRLSLIDLKPSRSRKSTASPWWSGRGARRVGTRSANSARFASPVTCRGTPGGSAPPRRPCARSRRVQFRTKPPDVLVREQVGEQGISN